MTRQKVNRPVELMDWLGLANAQFRVDRTIIPSSIPYILRRPKTSASQPKSIWPMTMPALVDALRVWLTDVGSTPLFPPKPLVFFVPSQKTTPRKVVITLMANIE